VMLAGLPIRRTVLACAPFAPSTSTKRTVRRQMI
jgi:hypothetical protein